MSDINDFVDPRIVPILEPDTLAELDSLISEYGLIVDHYGIAHGHGARLSLLQRIRLCVALLEPDCVNPKSKLYKAVGLLKRVWELCKE